MAQGLVRKLLPGFLAVAVFMTGDGFELTFLSKYVVDQGFSSSQASLLFTMYGLIAALAGWSSGVLSELFGPKRMMLIGAVSWIVLHLVFIGIALPSHIFWLMLVSYMLRGMGYPLFIYSFVVLLVQTVDPGKLSSALGWFWTAYSFGIGVSGAYLPAWIVPKIGEYETLWFSLVFSAIGTLICLFFMPKTHNAKLDTMSSSDKMRELARGVTILKDNHQIALAAVLRVICNLTLYGFPVIMPLYLATHNNGGGAWYRVTEWSTIWGLLFLVTVVGNVFWGRMGDRFGWMGQMRWWGCWLCAVGTLAMYYVPQFFGRNLPLMYLCAVVLGMGISAFVPMGAVFPALEPEHKGAAVSANNLASGLTTFCGPFIATMLLQTVGFAGVCWACAVCYIGGSIMSFWIRPNQPGLPERKSRRSRKLAA
ncbi:MFS transporter [Bifidobacterium subtile]|jgi:polyol permease family|uniref:Putative permease n=1 Tax=Bifidobacterium subtile TaxID=77635 RepID=A0A087E3U1_9BIFI|nr:MFS transporter [Bifidobacterium subtile]KFJ02442.1 putative permease [Bifidobacterium subtile]QOL35893.1 MFS transporter [Bifidobacterium subtile]